MSLKAFHLVFVTMAAALCLAFGGWCLRASQADSGAYILGAAGAVLTALALIAYGVVFYRKLGRID